MQVDTTQLNYKYAFRTFCSWEHNKPNDNSVIILGNTLLKKDRSLEVLNCTTDDFIMTPINNDLQKDAFFYSNLIKYEPNIYLLLGKLHIIVYDREQNSFS